MDDALDELLPELAAIALEGAKAVGKTATAAQRARTLIDLWDPATRQITQANPDLITHSPTPVLIDEWQLEPTIWDRV
ncbi:MAG: AAA family ATPase, partial [Candidatus Kapaibacterium sp.]